MLYVITCITFHYIWLHKLHDILLHALHSITPNYMSYMQLQVPSRSISRPWEALPFLWGEQATQKCPRATKVPKESRCHRASGFSRLNSGVWSLEPGLRQLSCGPTNWLLLRERVQPSVLWQGWSGSVMPPLEARTCLGTAYTVRIRPVTHVEYCQGCI